MFDPKYRQDVTAALSAVEHIPELRGSAKYYLLDRWGITVLYLGKKENPWKLEAHFVGNSSLRPIC